MYTSVMLVALSGFGSSVSTAETLTWQQDYVAARQQSAAVRKPVAVILGSGPAGWNKVVRGGSLDLETQHLLAAKYIPVYVDVSTPRGRKLARDFHMKRGVGIVISNSTGNLQAFRHEGTLHADNLLAYLERYANPNRKVVRTESNPSETQYTAFYGPSLTVAASTATASQATNYWGCGYYPCYDYCCYPCYNYCCYPCCNYCYYPCYNYCWYPCYNYCWYPCYNYCWYPCYDCCWGGGYCGWGCW